MMMSKSFTVHPASDREMEDLIDIIVKATELCRCQKKSKNIGLGDRFL